MTLAPLGHDSFSSARHLSDMDESTWVEIERVARECQRTWGMGFPVISTHLLRQILDGQKPDRPPSRPSEYLNRE